IQAKLPVRRALVDVRESVRRAGSDHHCGRFEKLRLDVSQWPSAGQTVHRQPRVDMAHVRFEYSEYFASSLTILRDPQRDLSRFRSTSPVGADRPPERPRLDPPGRTADKLLCDERRGDRAELTALLET